jgi:16S rRNA (guanine527-N7)-methyltransferase
MSLATGLQRGVTALGLVVPPAAQEQLLAYLNLLHKWNAAYNLTAVRGRERMLTHHVLDSLAVVPHLRGRRWVDVGSGAGLPGIPVALASPDAAVTLVDSNHKKTAFLEQAVIELSLRNVTVVRSRIEEWQPAQRFDNVISRALSDLPEFLALAGRLCAPDGVIAAMKGLYPHEEIAQVPPAYRLRRVVALEVPGLAAQRHLVLIEPA